VADDVVYSIQRAVETEGNTTAADFVGSYESVEALDDHTVRLTLKAPHALLFTLGRGLSGMAIVPREAVEQLGEDFALNPIGSGPFKFVEYKPDESLTLERNDLYWKKPYLDQVIYKVIPDQDAAVIALETGEVDILGSVPNADFERLNADNRFILYPGGCPIMVQLVFNMTNPLHSQLQFRQAVAYALDGDAIDANVYGGMHVSGCGTAGPGVPGYDPNLCKYFPYDPEGARALLKELGWEDTDGDGVLDKDGEPMEFPLEIWSMSPMPQFGVAVATQLKEIGIPVELQTVEFGTWIADWNAGVDKAMIMSGWCGDGGMNGLWGGEGMARAMGYDDAEVFELLESANTLVDPAERDKTLRAAADKIYSHYWAVPMGFHNFFQASRSWVHDFHGTLWFQNLCTEGNNVWLTK
jgi:peptide/nickel transport system substrate-binding protein